MKCSDATNEISAALAKAQGVINNPGKGKENPHFKSQYADLSAGIKAIREGLSANGIAVIQATRVEGDVMILDTRLSHASGQWFEADYPVCKFPSAPQVTGSALTYARRYSLFGMVGIAGEDDDGNAASTAQTPSPARVERLSDVQVEELDTILVELGEEVDAGFKKHMNVQFLSEIAASQFDYAKKVLVKKKAQADAAKPTKHVEAEK